jgi:hypothetical protein
MPVSRTSGQGRPKGVPNKKTAEIKGLAQSFGPAAIMRLAELGGFATDPTDPTGQKKLPAATSEMVQVAAAKELLDRGFGKSVQPESGPDGESNPIVEVRYSWAASPPE